MPTESDYIFHLSLGLLAECCMNDDVNAIIPRIILNNLAIKINCDEVQLEIPKHQDWALKIFGNLRADLIPDFITKMKLSDKVDEEVLLNVTKKQLDNHKYNDAALMMVRYKFQKHFDLKDIMMKLVDLNKIETAKMLIVDDDILKVELIKNLSTNDNCKKAAQLIKDFHLSEKDFPEVKERLMKKGIRYYLSRNLHKKKNHKEYLSLDRVEDLISGFKQMLAYMVEDLAHNKKWHEAVGVMTRNNVENYVR